LPGVQRIGAIACCYANKNGHRFPRLPPPRLVTMGGGELLNRESQNLA
jgi:hypothetical protein